MIIGCILIIVNIVGMFFFNKKENEFIVLIFRIILGSGIFILKVKIIMIVLFILVIVF